MLGPIPTYGFYARHSLGLIMQNIRFQVAQPDLRPAVVLDHVTDVAMNALNVDWNAEAESCLRLIDAKEVLITAARVLTPASVFLQLEGSGNERIVIDGGDISKAATQLKATAAARETAAKFRVWSQLELHL